MVVNVLWFFDFVDDGDSYVGDGDMGWMVVVYQGVFKVGVVFVFIVVGFEMDGW